MLYLIDYDQRHGLLVLLRPFTDDQRDEANAARLELELRHARLWINREVVIIEADSEEALWSSHARYFRTIQEILEALRDVAHP